MATDSELRALGAKAQQASDARRRERRDALKRERDMALREIGLEWTEGLKQLDARAERKRAAVWSKFKRDEAALRR